MSRRQKPVARMKLRELLGPPPLLRSEKHKFYNEVLARLTQCLQPRDWMEQNLVQNLADCTWEMARDIPATRL